MNFFAAHPWVITLALIALVVWWIGNYIKRKLLVIIGILFTVAALAAFVLGG